MGGSLQGSCPPCSSTPAPRSPPPLPPTPTPLQDIDEAEPLVVRVSACRTPPVLPPHAKYARHLAPPEAWQDSEGEGGVGGASTDADPPTAADDQAGGGGGGGASGSCVGQQCEVAGGYVYITVTDCGGGISDAALARVVHYFATSHQDQLHQDG